ncbi:MAG: winged helix-turn-helix domain-containing protein [Phycisphaeraceae bacterium]|nr:winged helix-turn-helix domain-containing protein [Phycisphaeraceae bacterium]MCW5763638.1 winged helix-turn-helix domain-containing protein [Phycisphaeraceae bacterium]
MTTTTTTTKKTTQKKASTKKAAAKKTSKATPSQKATTKPDHANARTAAGERARKEAIAIAHANIDRIEAGEPGAARHSPAHAARVANGEIRLGKDAPTPNDATRASVGQTRAKAPKALKPKSDSARKPSGLDLAAKVLTEAREPLSAKAIAERAIAAGWVTSGATPHATLYAAIIREIASKGDAARFRKTDRGLFEAGPSTKKGA